MQRTLLCLALATTAAHAQSGWEPPVLLTALNTVSSDTSPHLSIDGLTLHFASFRNNNWEIYSTTRTGRGQPWTTPVLETAIGDPAQVDNEPFLSADGLELWFSSLRNGSATGFEVFRATRAGVGLPWSTPVPVVEVNGPGSEASVSLTADGLELYMLSTSFGNPAGNNNSIYRATRTSTALPFGTPTLVNELYTGNTHRDAEISWDGLRIVYTEYDPAVARMQVFRAERTSRSVPFQPPVAWSEWTSVGTSIGVYSMTVSLDGSEAIVAANFGAAGSQEFMTSRFQGVTHFGVAGANSSMQILYRDGGSPGMLYAFGAALGNTGFTLDTRHVPLDLDWVLTMTFATGLPPFSTGFSGNLDGNGEAIATLTNVASILLGVQIHVAAVTLDANAPSTVRTISNSFALRFQ